jgi:hypothetical protein
MKADPEYPAYNAAPSQPLGMPANWLEIPFNDLQ